MNTNHLEIAKELENEQIAFDLFRTFADELSPGADCVVTRSGIMFNAFERRDVEIFMSVAPGAVWHKQTNGACIRYGTTVDNKYHSIYAFSAALPPTCRTEKRKRYVPASEAREIEEEFVVYETPTISDVPTSN